MSNDPGELRVDSAENIKSENEQTLPLKQIAMTAGGFLVSLIVLTVFMNTVGLPRLQELARSSGALGPIAYITIKALAFVIAPLSSGPLQIASGPIFTLELAILYTLIGDVIGGSINFLITRHLGRPVLERLVNDETLEKMDKLYQGRVDKWYTLAVARAMFFFMWDILSYAAGLAKTIPFITYFLVSVFVGLPVTMVSVTVGEKLLTDTTVLYAFIGMVVIALALIFLFRRQIANFLVRVNKIEDTVQE